MRNRAMLKLVTITTTSFSSKTPFVNSVRNGHTAESTNAFLQNLVQSLCIDDDVY
jgi:hypothetical protein